MVRVIPEERWGRKGGEMEERGRREGGEREEKGRRKGGERGEICEQRPVMSGVLRVKF